MVDCPECDGDGRQMGDGEWEDCEECDGSGEIECSECGGDGRSSCDECDGRGRLDCEECDQRGEIESDTKVEYTLETFLSWNNDLKNLAEIRMNTQEGFNYDEFEDLINKNSLKISTRTENGELESWMEGDTYYIYDLNDEGEDLEFNSTYNIVSLSEPDSYVN
jgi:RecJ-like exonuclease